MTLELRHHSSVEPARRILVDIHVEVRQRDFGLAGTFYSAERFDERLSGHSSLPGWETVVAYDGSEPAGFVCATPLGPGTRWCAAMTAPLPEGYTTETGTHCSFCQGVSVRRASRMQSIPVRRLRAVPGNCGSGNGRQLLPSAL
ncbi:hypothetical protein ACWD25_03310 [Streptomyces sp. NPDC002920]